MALAGQGKTRGTVAITEIELCTNQSLAAIVTDNTVDDDCLRFYLENQYQNLREISSGDGTRGGLNLTLINEYIVSLPSVDEQKKIAKFLTILEQRINKQQCLINALKSYKRGLLRKVFSHLTSDWKEIKLGDIATIYQPQTIAATEMIEGGTYPVYGANGLIGYYDKYNHDSEQIAICCRGASCGTVNYIPSYSWITGNAMVININTKKAEKRFIYYQLLSANLSYMVSGSGQPQIVRTPCVEHRIFLPRMDKQIAISKQFSILDKLINSYEQLLTNLIKQKTALLQQLFI